MHLRHAALLAGFVLLCGGCRRKPSPEVQAVIDTERATVLKVAGSAVGQCEALAPFRDTPMTAPPMPASPANGTSLESDQSVVDVTTVCMWPRKLESSTGAASGPWLRSLKGANRISNRALVPGRAVSVRADTKELAVNTCNTDERNCEQIIVPSHYSQKASSADLRIVRPLAEGGWTEVTTIIEAP